MGIVLHRSKHKHARARNGTYHVIHDPGTFQQVVQWIHINRLLDRSPGFNDGTMHAAFGNPHPCRIGSDGLLIGNFCAIGKRGCHEWFYSPFFCKSLLRGGIAIRIEQTFDVAAEDRPDAHAFYGPVQVQHDAGLVAIRVRIHNPGFIRVCFQDRTHCPVHLGVHSDEVFFILDRLKRDTGCKFKASRCFKHHIYSLRLAEC